MNFGSARVLLQSILLLLLTFSPLTNGANVLFFFGLSTYSHRITAWPLAVKLAEQGHSVTFLQVTKNKNPHPNVTDFLPKEVEHPVVPNLVDLRVQYGIILVHALSIMLPKMGVDMCSQFLSNKENVEWVNRQHFDLVIVDALCNDCGYGLAWKWKAKTILFGTTHVFEWFPDSFGFPDESATYPSLFFSQKLPLGFFGRVMASLSYLFVYFMKELRGVAPLDVILRDKLQMPDMPPISEQIRNTSLLFVNTHFSEEVARSLPPFAVPIGGMHVSEKVNALPKEMEEFIKSSDEFIYMSFGSEADLAKSSKSLEHIREIFFNATGKSRTKFLWKWNGQRPKEMPANVFTSSWMPQQDVLGHPKCKGFITHGGLLSMQEAVYHAVPMIVFPIFAEQDYNAERLQRTGRGIGLEFGSLTQSKLDDGIHRLLTDPSLKQQMKLASIRFKDRPEKPVDTALFWVDYVMRHQDTTFLKPLAINLSWYQRRQLDVWCFLLMILLVAAYITKKIVTRIFIKLCGGRTKKPATIGKSKKKN